MIYVICEFTKKFHCFIHVGFCGIIFVCKPTKLIPLSEILDFGPPFPSVGFKVNALNATCRRRKMPIRIVLSSVANPQVMAPVIKAGAICMVYVLPSINPKD